MTLRPGGSSKFLLAAALLASTGTAACGADSGEPSRPSLTSACGVEFEVLTGWMLADTSANLRECSIRLDIADRAQRDSSSIMGEFEVLVTVRQGATDSVATELGFVRRDTGWVVLGRQAMESAAIEYGRGEWRGVQGIAEVGCSSRIDSTYAGLCDMSRAVVGSGAVIVAVDAGPGGAEAFQRVLMTLRSTRAPR